MRAAPRLLVIRESHQIAEGLARLLEREELQSSVSTSCQDGSQRLTALSPSIVIIDCSASTPPGGPAAFERLLVEGAADEGGSGPPPEDLPG